MMEIERQIEVCSRAIPDVCASAQGKVATMITVTVDQLKVAAPNGNPQIIAAID